MARREIPFLFIRGGTSRGPYFNAADLPSDRDTIAKILLQVVGAGHPLNIDGIGGGNAVTNKVAMLSRSADDAADIDYFFAQVSVLEQLVDFKPTCGNILSGVGPAAIEMGLMPASDPLPKCGSSLLIQAHWSWQGCKRRVGSCAMMATPRLMACPEPPRGLTFNSWMLLVRQLENCCQLVIFAINLTILK